MHLVVCCEGMLRDVVDRVLHCEDAAGNLILNIDHELEHAEKEWQSTEQAAMSSTLRECAKLGLQNLRGSA